MRELSIFKRGQVWYIDDKRRNIGSIQGKSRPYLVVSNDKCNANSPVIHMAPLTTQDKTSLPTHVQFYDPVKRISQVVLLEQTMPKSVPDISSIAEYKYTLSEEKMNEVDRALAIQFGVPYGGVSIEEFEKLLDKLCEIKIAQIREEAEKVNTNRANKYIEKLLEVVDQVTPTKMEVPTVESQEPTKIEEPNPSSSAPAATSTRTVIQKPMSQVDKFNARLAKSKELQGKNHPVTTPASSNDGSKKRHKWTIELKKQFLADANNPNLTKDQVMEKYGMAPTTYTTMLCKFRKELALITSAEKPTNNSKSEAEKFLDDYDSKPISEMMKLYGLSDKKAVVTKAASYRAQLGR